MRVVQTFGFFFPGSLSAFSSSSSTSVREFDNRFRQSVRAGFHRAPWFPARPACLCPASPAVSGFPASFRWRYCSFSRSLCSRLRPCGALRSAHLRPQRVFAAALRVPPAWPSAALRCPPAPAAIDRDVAADDLAVRACAPGSGQWFPVRYAATGSAVPAHGHDRDHAGLRSARLPVHFVADHDLPYAARVHRPGCPVLPALHAGACARHRQPGYLHPAAG